MGKAKNTYCAPYVRRERKLAEVTEGNAIAVTGGDNVRTIKGGCFGQEE